MKAIFLFLKSIVWRDLFKHRYGLLVEEISMPTANFSPTSIVDKLYNYDIAITRLPIERPFTQSYNDFVRNNTRKRTMFFTGSKSTLKKLGNIGSVLPNNWKQLKRNKLAAKYGSWMEYDDI